MPNTLKPIRRQHKFWRYSLFWLWQELFNTLVLLFLAPTGALIVIVSYYWSGNFFRFWAFLPIYLVFLFENWIQIDNNWPWTSFLSFSLSIYEIYDIYEIHDVYEIHDINEINDIYEIHDIYDIYDIYDSVCLLLVSFCRSIPPEFLQSFLWFLQDS